MTGFTSSLTLQSGHRIILADLFWLQQSMAISRIKILCWGNHDHFWNSESGNLQYGTMENVQLKHVDLAEWIHYGLVGKVDALNLLIEKPGKFQNSYVPDKAIIMLLDGIRDKPSISQDLSITLGRYLLPEGAGSLARGEGETPCDKNIPSRDSKFHFIKAMLFKQEILQDKVA